MNKYLRLGKNEAERRNAYCDLFKACIEPEMLHATRNATNGNYVLGDNRFQAEMEAMLQRRVAPGTNGRPPKSKMAGDQARVKFHAASALAGG